MLIRVIMISFQSLAIGSPYDPVHLPPPILPSLCERVALCPTGGSADLCPAWESPSVPVVHAANKLTARMCRMHDWQSLILLSCTYNTRREDQLLTLRPFSRSKKKGKRWLVSSGNEAVAKVEMIQRRQMGCRQATRRVSEFQAIRRVAV